jgi:hypothetical protein
MGFNQEIEACVSKIVSAWKNTDAKKMFGSVCHLLDGKMFGGLH